MEARILLVEPLLVREIVGGPEFKSFERISPHVSAYVF